MLGFPGTYWVIESKTIAIFDFCCIIIYAAFCVCQAQPRHYQKSWANPGIKEDPVLCMDEIGDYKGCKDKFQVLNISNDRTRCQINMKTGTKRRIRLVDGSQSVSNELSDAGESEPEPSDASSWSAGWSEECGASTEPAAIAPQSSSSPIVIAPQSLSSLAGWCFHDYWLGGVCLSPSIIPPSVCPLLSREAVATCKATLGVERLHQDIIECSTCGIGIQLNGKDNIVNEHGKGVPCLCRSTKLALLAEGWWAMYQKQWQCPACQYHEDKEKFNRSSPLFTGVKAHFASAFKRDDSSARDFVVCHSHRVRAGNFLDCGAYGPESAMPAAAAANDNRIVRTPSPPPPPAPPAKLAGPVTASKAAAPSPPAHQKIWHTTLQQKINEMDAKVQGYFWAEL